ncbi:MAG: hypothetical protein LBN01_04575 [Endomicrobium sp.]|nr:hypothetical protein [Endomicrobium sp.]
MKSIQPANNQIIQSNGNHSVKLNNNLTGQSNNSQVGQPNDSQNTETNEQKHYLTGSTVVCIAGGLVAIVLLALAGYAVYRHYHVLPNPLELQAGRLYTVEDILNSRLISSDVNLLTNQERFSLNYSHPQQRVYAFLSDVYSTRYKRYSRHYHLSDSVALLRNDRDTNIWIMLNEFNKEMVYRRALAGLQLA